MQRLKRNCNYCFMSNSVYHSDYNYRILIKLIAELFCFKAKSVICRYLADVQRTLLVVGVRGFYLVCILFYMLLKF